MDFHHRGGGKTGSMGFASAAESAAERKERLRRLALQVIDLASDPYLLKNHLGTYECKLCLTLHQNEGSYLSHTQGKKHQTNLARRAAREAIKEGGSGEGPALPPNATVKMTKKVLVKIGRPGYKVTKVRDPENRCFGLLFQIQYPDMPTASTPLQLGGPPSGPPHFFSPSGAVTPQYRFMSAFEQRIEVPPNKAYQYLLIAAEPYETIAFKIQNKAVDLDKTIEYWDRDAKQYTLQIMFKSFQ